MTEETVEQTSIKEEFSDILAGWAEEEDEYKREKKEKYIWTDLARERMDYYMGCMEESKPIDIRFNVISKNGYLFAYDNGITIIMSWHALANDIGAQLMRDYKGKSGVLDKEYTVKVTGCNDTGTHGPVVYVSQKRTLNDRKHEAEKAIDEVIAQKKKVLFPAKVVCVIESMNGIVLNIGGYGIKGFCSFKDWSELGETISKPWLIKPGTVVYVRITSKIKLRSQNNKEKQKRYTYSRIDGGYRCIRRGGAHAMGRTYSVGEEVECVVVQNRDWGGFAYIDSPADAAVKIMASKEKKHGRYDCYERYLVRITRVNSEQERIHYNGEIVKKIEEM